MSHYDLGKIPKTAEDVVRDRVTDLEKSVTKLEEVLLVIVEKLAENEDTGSMSFKP